jgi:hypothetical protein
MRAIKAKAADKPRVVKSWRIKSDIVKRIKALAVRQKKSESELVEMAVEALDLWLETPYDTWFKK